MIYTVTFNPALDVTGVVEKLIPNEKCYVHSEIHTPGGNGINSGIIANRLGSKVVLTGFIGGSNGEAMRRLLNKEKIDQCFISITGSTRLNLTISNQDDHRQTRLSFPGPRITGPEKIALEDFLKSVGTQDTVILGGSLPLNITTLFVKKLVKKIKAKGARCMVDMPGELLKDVVKAKPYFIKPNLLEFQSLLGKKMTTSKAVIKSAQDLIHDIPLICVSSVEGGALLISANEVWYGKIPNIKIRSTVGAGDSMVGAIAHLLDKKSDATLEELLRLGLAASCATLAEKGLTLGQKKTINYYGPKIILKKLK